MGFALYCVCQTAYTQLKLRFGAQAKKVQPVSTVLPETAEGVAAIAEIIQVKEVLISLNLFIRQNRLFAEFADKRFFLLHHQ